MELKGIYTEEFFNVALNSIEEGVMFLDENYRVKFINTEGERIIGEGQRLIIEEDVRSIFRIFSANDLQIANSFFNNKSNSEEYISCFLVNRKNQKFFIKARLKPLNVSLQGSGYLLFFKVNNEVVDNTRSYKGLFDNATEGIFILDDSGAIIDVNLSACEIYQLKKDDFLKMNVADVVPHKSSQEISLLWSDFIRVGYMDGFYKYKTSTGEDKYIEFKLKNKIFEKYHLAIFSDVTQRIQIEKALRNSEANLKAIFNNANQSLILIDLDYNIVTFNEEAHRHTLETTGIEIKENISIFKLVKQGEEEKYRALYERVKNGEIFSFEYCVGKIHDSDCWLDIGLMPVFDHNNKIRGILVSCSDISLRKKTELNLQESEARFRSLVQNASDIITILDDSNNIKYTSFSIEKILGYKEKELVGRNIIDFIHEEEKDLVRNLLKKNLRKDYINPVLEYRFLHADGYYLYLETICNNLMDNEDVKGVVLNTRDVTERKYQEENLLLLERAIDSSNNGIIISDPNTPDNPIIYVNKAFEHITGYHYLDIIGKNCRYLQGDDRDQEEIQKIRAAIEEHKEVNVILRNYKSDGKLFWNQLSISPVFNKNKDITNYIGVINDITEKKIAEDTLLEISQGISTSDKVSIYDSIVKNIGYRLSVDFCMIGEIVGDNKVRSRSYWKDGEIQDNIEYEISGTPCERVIKKGLPEYIEDVDKLFPEFTILSKGKFVSYIGVPLKDSKGKIIGIIVVMSRSEFQNKLVVESVINIFSVRVSAELERDYYIAALKSSESRFKDLAKNSPDLIYIVDAEIKRAIYFNRDNIFGYTRDELSVSEGWSLIVHPDDVKLLEKHWKLFLKSSKNETRDIEYRIKNKEGVYEWVINRHVVIERDIEGTPKLILLNLTVITERKNVENALRESELKLTALIENTNDVMWSVDANFVFTTMNSACKNVFKEFFNIDIKVGDSLLSSLPESIKIQCLDLHQRTFKGENVSKEFNIKGKSGVVSYEMSYYPIYTDQGAISGASVFARDITQRKIAENDIIRTNFELDSFVYRASHDLRAPLRSVLGLINLIKTELDEQERNTYLGLVEKSINKLDTFISDLTNFSRNSRVEVVIEEIDFNSIIDDCLENLKYMDNAERIKTYFVVEGDFKFYSDVKRISIVLQNIISNAIKYQNHRVDNSYVNININVDKDFTKITIEDNGRGIKDEYVDKIFDMFFRASQESYGSGLGLYIVKQVVEKLNGTIRVSSKLGVGTEFVLRLPNLKKEDFIEE